MLADKLQKHVFDFMTPQLDDWCDWESDTREESLTKVYDRIEEVCKAQYPDDVEVSIFEYDVDSDCFDIADAFHTVLTSVKDKGQPILDAATNMYDAEMFITVITKK